jgi:hypothetical protein
MAFRREHMKVRSIADIDVRPASGTRKIRSGSTQ